MDLSFQLYSAREHGPWSAVFERLAALGYSAVEGYAALYDDPARLADELAAHGLSMPSAHFALDALEREPAATHAIARTLDVGTLYAPHVAASARPTDLAGWKAFARRLARVGERAAGEGFAFGWHNHDFELAPLDDGSVPLDVLLGEAPDIGWEADLAWIARAGADPAAWLASHGARATAVHVKDIAPAGERRDEDGWADPGEGTMDWEGLMGTLLAGGVERLYIAEHDRPADVERFARRAQASFARWTEAPA